MLGCITVSCYYLSALSLIQVGAWHQVPVPRGLRGLCADQPAKHFLPAGAQ